jgi:hypothetical protein
LENLDPGNLRHIEPPPFTGSKRVASVATICISSSNKSRRTMYTPPRIDTVASAPCSQRSARLGVWRRRQLYAHVHERSFFSATRSMPRQRLPAKPLLDACSSHGKPRSRPHPTPHEVQVSSDPNLGGSRSSRPAGRAIGQRQRAAPRTNSRYRRCG